MYRWSATVYGPEIDARKARNRRWNLYLGSLNQGFLGDVKDQAAVDPGGAPDCRATSLRQTCLVQELCANAAISMTTVWFGVPLAWWPSRQGARAIRLVALCRGCNALYAKPSCLPHPPRP